MSIRTVSGRLQKLKKVSQCFLLKVTKEVSFADTPCVCIVPSKREFTNDPMYDTKMETLMYLNNITAKVH